MTLTVGTDTYISVTDANTYFNGRLNSSVWISPYQEQALRMACKALDRENWIGTLATTMQALCWPRLGVTDKDGRSIDPTVVPQAIRDAQCELALKMLVDDLTDDSGTLGVHSVNAGGVAIVYDGAAQQRRIPDIVKAIISPFLAFGGAGDGASVPLVF